MTNEATTQYTNANTAASFVNDKNNNNNDEDPTTTSTSLWHGLGLFGESYLLFSIGTLRPLWEMLYPSCFDEYDNSTCPRPYLSYKSITYSVVLGVMVGMIVLGVLANSMGRRRGSIVTASLMAGGAVSLTLASLVLSNSPSVLFPTMSISLFVFGIGVGGEYPLSASSASERAMGAMKKRRERESLDHVVTMKQLLRERGGESGEICSSNNNSNNISSRRRGQDTPRASNSSTRNETDAVDGATPWQKLEQPRNENSLSIQPDLTPVEESYGDVPLSPTNITRGTTNSLSSGHAKLRTRGRDVLLVFSMQGVGIFANSLILTFLLMVTKHRGGENGYENGGGGDDDANDNNIGYEYDQSTLLNIWRIVYATGTLVLVYVLVSRILHLTESEVWSQDRIQRTAELANRMNRENVEEGFSPLKVGPYEKEMATLDTNFGDAEPPIISPTMSSITMRSDFEGLGSTNLDGCRVVPVVMEDMICKAPGEYSVKSKPSEMTLLLQHYGVRLFGTSATWLLWDIAFYGNKLFQSSFLIAMTGEDASLVDITCGEFASCKALFRSIVSSCGFSLLCCISLCHQRLCCIAWVLRRCRHH